MIAFAQFDTVFLANALDARKFAPNQQLYLFREGKAVSEHAVTVVKCDDCVGFIKLKDPHRVCSRAQRGDDLRKEVG